MREEHVTGELVGGASNDEILSRLDRFVQQTIKPFRGYVTVTITHPDHDTDQFKFFVNGHSHVPFHEVRNNYFYQRMTDARPLGVTVSFE